MAKEKKPDTIGKCTIIIQNMGSAYSFWRQTYSFGKASYHSDVFNDTIDQIEVFSIYYINQYLDLSLEPNC